MSNDNLVEIALTAPLAIIMEPPIVEGYWVAAKDFFNCVKSFDSLQSQHYRSYSLLAGFALENGLKAFLSTRGCSESDLRKYGHDLRTLWSKCHADGLGIDANMPPHICILADGHFMPDFVGAQRHAIRYPIGIHGQQYPNYVEMVSALQNVFFLVEQQT